MLSPNGASFASRSREFPEYEDEDIPAGQGVVRAPADHAEPATATWTRLTAQGRRTQRTVPEFATNRLGLANPKLFFADTPQKSGFGEPDYEPIGAPEHCENTDEWDAIRDASEDIAPTFSELSVGSDVSEDEEDAPVARALRTVAQDLARPLQPPPAARVQREALKLFESLREMLDLDEWTSATDIMERVVDKRVYHDILSITPDANMQAVERVAVQLSLRAPVSEEEFRVAMRFYMRQLHQQITAGDPERNIGLTCISDMDWTDRLTEKPRIVSIHREALIMDFQRWAKANGSLRDFPVEKSQAWHEIVLSFTAAGFTVTKTSTGGKCAVHPSKERGAVYHVSF